MSFNYRKQIQCFRENKSFQSFITEMKNQPLQGDNKRILNILLDDDLEQIEEKLTHRELKYLGQLDILVLDLIKFLKMEITDVGYGILSQQTVYGLLSYVDSKLLQIMKIRMVIKPEILPTLSTHSVTKHKYVVLRAFWLDNNFKKIRKFSISLGNIENIGDFKKINPKDYKEQYKELSSKIENLYETEYG